MAFIKRIAYAVARKTKNLPTPIERGEEAAEYEISLDGDTNHNGPDDEANSVTTFDSLIRGQCVRQ